MHRSLSGMLCSSAAGPHAASPRAGPARASAADMVTLLGTLGVVGGRAGLLPPGRVLRRHVVIRSSSSPTCVDGTWRGPAAVEPRGAPSSTPRLDRIGDGGDLRRPRTLVRRGRRRRPLLLRRRAVLPGHRLGVVVHQGPRPRPRPDRATSGIVERAERLVIVLVATGSRTCSACPYLLPIALWAPRPCRDRGHGRPADGRGAPASARPRGGCMSRVTESRASGRSTPRVRGRAGRRVRGAARAGRPAVVVACLTASSPTGGARQGRAAAARRNLRAGGARRAPTGEPR